MTDTVEDPRQGDVLYLELLETLQAGGCPPLSPGTARRR